MSAPLAPVVLEPETSAAESEALRVRLAASPQTAPETLRDLLSDPSITVRGALIMNPATPPELHDTLARDADERVRALLGRRLAALLPQLADAEREGIARRTLATLAILIEDEAERVRAAIADVVKEMPQAPHPLILRLAQDSAVPVSDPVLRLSPVLTPADLLALLHDAPNATAATAIARRAGLDESVCDAIAASADSAAIAALLANPSAAIRESTLDALVARAAAHAEWHDPLVRRPRLSGRSARLLSDVVANHLLEVLADRTDLDPSVTSELRARLQRRLAPMPGPVACMASLEEATAQARTLFERGLLDEQAVQDAAQRGDLPLCTAMLAVAADMPTSAVERVAQLRNAKGLVSVVWAGGFSMKLGQTVQTGLGSLGPGTALRATPNGDFPLEPDEMRWQIDLLRRMTG